MDSELNEQKTTPFNESNQANAGEKVRKPTVIDEGPRLENAEKVWKPTVIDEGPRLENAEKVRKPTVIDEGPRPENAEKVRKPTVIDEGPRLENAEKVRKPTVIDDGPTPENAEKVRRPTVIDEGPRLENAEKVRKPTVIDEGPKPENAEKVRRPTVIDEGWKNKVENMLDPANIMNKATANYFPQISDFKNAVAELSQLVSSKDNVYSVKKTISADGGEGIILLCSDPDGKDVAAKVYYEPVNSAGSSVSARTRVLEYMATDEGQQYTLAVSDIGLVEFGKSRYYFEIIPFVEDGDISHKQAFSFNEICEFTKQLNEALRSIHNFGILHRDIKPQNIFEIDGRYVLGDFGTAQIAEKGTAHVTRHRVYVYGYTAPELCLSISGDPAFIYDNKCDYYSLGITIGSLFEGHFVYDNMDQAMILTSVKNSRLPLRRDDPKREQLENLLNGLCRYDPKFRFGYENVNSWLLDHNYTGGITEDEWPKPYRMLGSEYRDEKSLFMGITKDEEHWNEAKSMLFNKYFENFFKSFRTDLARAAQTADEIYRSDDRDKGLSVFLKNLFAPGQIVWKGYSYSGLQELGDKMVVAKTPAAYAEILQKHCISHWLANTEGISVNEENKKLVDDIEALSVSEPEIACYWFGNSFAKKRQLTVCGKTVSTIPELITAMFTVPSDFYREDGLTKMLDRRYGADFYGFLFSFGYKGIIDEEWKYLKQCDMFNKTSLLISMMDNIAVKAEADPKIIRNFFVKYGPVGIATYTKRLITENNVYTALDANGKEAISKIKSFRAPAAGTIDELFKAYTPLIEEVKYFRKILIDNPFCVAAGEYEPRGVICKNLVGCFAFKIFERLAPLGFNALIDTAKGGSK